MSYKIKLVPLSERETKISSAISASTKKADPLYDFRKGTYAPPLVSLPIDLPVYRMENCRTFSEQQNEIATKSLPVIFFSKGQELSSAQTAQHQILAALAQRGGQSVSPILEVLEADGQREPILITSTGVVVNGNRRLAAMRELYSQPDGSTDQRFAYVDCAVLPSDATPDELDDIEAYLQARPHTKLDYDWIGDAKLVKRQVDKGRSTKQVGDQLRRSKAEIENLLQALEEADLYLSRWRKKPGQYALISSDAEQIFTDLPKRLAGKTVALQDASRLIAWSLLDNRDKLSGRLYGYNAAFGKLAPQVLELFADQLGIGLEEVKSEEADSDGLLFEVEADEALDYSPLTDALSEEQSREDAVSALIEAAELAIEKERGRNSGKAALKALALAHGKLAAIDVTGAAADTLNPMVKQLESIRAVLQRIEEKLTLRLQEKVNS